MSEGATIDPWRVLGTDPTMDRGAVRKAYARRLKAIDPEADPDAFIELRHARDWAMWQADGGGEGVDADPKASPVASAGPQRGASPEALPDPAAPAQLDHDAMATLDAMVLDPASPATDAEIEAQTERVLSGLRLFNIDEAIRCEDFISRLIVQGTPRSDAMLDPAILSFRWDADRPDHERAPIVGWVAQRQIDIGFENDLPQRSRPYAGLLRELRRPELPRHPRWTAWRLGPRIEYLLAYTQRLHPTVLAGVDQSKIAWWADRIHEQKAAALPVRWLREQRRRIVWARGIDWSFDWTALFLYAGILVAPLFCVWFLLGRGHSTTARVLGFGFLAAILLYINLADTVKDASPPVSAPITVVAEPHYQDFATDLKPVLADVTSYTVDPAGLRARNPALWRSLEAQWWAAARERLAFPVYQDQAAAAIDALLGEALKAGNDELLLDFVRAYNARLRWAERASADDCADIIAGREEGPRRANFDDYHRRLVGRAILAGTAPPLRPEDAGGDRFVTIPPAIFDDAERRSRLGEAAFRQGLRGEGSSLARCNAHIALIDAAVLSGGSAGRTLLRAMFAPAPSRRRT